MNISLKSLSRSAVLMISLAAVLTLSLSAEAASTGISGFSTAVSDDGNVVVAAYPYTVKSRRKEIVVDTNNKKLYPVGIMVQNYGKDSVILRYPLVKEEEKGSVYVHKFQSFRRSYLGGIAGKQFFKEGEDMNITLHAQHKSGTMNPRLSMGELFAEKKLNTGQAYYGLVFLDKRDGNNKTVALNDVQNVVIRVPFYVGGPKKWCVAEMPLNAEGSGDIKCRDLSNRAGKSNGPWKGVRYVGPDGERPNDKTIVSAIKALDGCLQKSKIVVQEEMKMKNIKRKFTQTQVCFDRYGNQITYEILKASDNLKLDKYTKAVAENMKRCDLKSGDTGGDGGKGEKFYEIKYILGDPVFVEILDKEARSEEQ